MPVLIDGNNLLYAARNAEDERPLVGRSILCDTIGQWVRRRGERVHVVFDGPAPEANLAKQIGNPDISVSYSGGTSADAVIIDILDTDSAARRLLVVSTDGEIVRSAKRRRAKSIRSDEFWALLKQDLAHSPPKRIEPKEKQDGLEPLAVDQWLCEFGFGQQSDGPSKGG